MRLFGNFIRSESKDTQWSDGAMLILDFGIWIAD
jgi:hypothetical protein